MASRHVLAALLAVVLTLGLALAALAKEPDVGTPAFKNIASRSGILKYGFRGAAVYDNATRQWHFVSMTTITRHKVAGYVNQINNNLALAAGLYWTAVYDFRAHAWRVYKSKGGVDDSTGNLKKNFVLTDTYARVKYLNAPYVKYQNGSWSRSK
jgi:hypothetical protein